ncbi:DUF4326 domain-containing protein [Bosea sp. (in: a-proteobacteria)]|uniref:DUF4326 domain-containing protein n=1 Tax=Bosea sp. (in: a-proteobacteria) TaxID=1871050 RepID=UPI0025B7C2D1|nr:DUF4326 domain-containing protein [Bosea sp. (in: a-proteobacteria)]
MGKGLDGVGIRALSQPTRLQLSRRKGFDLQAWSMETNGLPALNVARPSRWGNPFTKEAAIESGYATDETWPAFVVGCFRDWLGPSQSGRDWWQGPKSDAAKSGIFGSIEVLRGKNLACWCKVGAPCHADVLLELANAPASLADAHSKNPPSCGEDA